MQVLQTAARKPIAQHMYCATTKLHNLQYKVRSLLFSITAVCRCVVYPGILPLVLVSKYVLIIIFVVNKCDCAAVWRIGP